MSFDWQPESKDRYFRKARSRCILSRFRERERPADGGRQRKASQGCRSSPEGVTSSAGKRKPFLFMPI